MPGLIDPWLTVSERREIARERHPGGGRNDHLHHFGGVGRRCAYCYSPLPNGRSVCGDACDDGWWNVCPTVTGELWIK